MEQDALMESMSAEALQALYAKTVYVLRESRKETLRRYGVDSEAALLARIRNGEVDEHPAYDHYLSALIFEQTRMQMRSEMMEQFNGAPAVADVCMHLIFKDKLERLYAQRMTEPVRLAQDAIMLSFDTGLMMEVRYVSSAEFSLNWSWGEAELRIDTAPVHAGGATFPVHVHDENGRVRASPVAWTDPDGWQDFSGLLEVLLLDPLLERSGFL
jgi:hypothetical protein